MVAVFTRILLLAMTSTRPNLAMMKRSTSTRPNIVVLLADDFGYGDLQSYGNPSQESGHIDALATNGVRFTSWYSAESVCTPSRAALQTGRLPIRSGMVPGFPITSVNVTMEPRVLSVDDSGGLPSNETTIAELLKRADYRTGFVGKWHQGINSKAGDGAHLPSNHGYDFVGLNLPFTNHWTCDESGKHMALPDVRQCMLFDGDDVIQQPIDHSNLTAIFAEDAVNFILESAGGGGIRMTPSSCLWASRRCT